MGSYNRERSRRTMCTIICRWRRYGTHRKHLPKSIVSCCGRLGVSCLQFCEKRKWVTVVKVNGDTCDEVDGFCFYRLGRFAFPLRSPVSIFHPRTSCGEIFVSCSFWCPGSSSRLSSPNCASGLSAISRRFWSVKTSFFGLVNAYVWMGRQFFVNSTPHTSPFSRSQRARVMMCDTTLAQVLVRVIPSMRHAPEWLFVPSLSLSLRSSPCSLPCVSLSSTSSSWTLTSTFSPSMWMSSEQDPLCTPPIEESGPLANNAPLTGSEPNLFDDFHYSETTEIYLQEQSSDTMPSYLHDAELSDDTFGRALSSPLFTQEREEPADRRQAYHFFEESLLPSQSLSVCQVRTGRPIHDLSSLGSSSREKPSCDSENEQIRIRLQQQKKSKFSLIVEQRFRNTNFRPIMMEEVSRNWME